MLSRSGERACAGGWRSLRRPSSGPPPCCVAALTRLAGGVVLDSGEEDEWFVGAIKLDWLEEVAFMYVEEMNMVDPCGKAGTHRKSLYVNSMQGGLRAR